MNLLQKYLENQDFQKPVLLDVAEKKENIQEISIGNIPKIKDGVKTVFFYFCTIRKPKYVRIIALNFKYFCNPNLFL